MGPHDDGGTDEFPVAGQVPLSPMSRDVEVDLPPPSLVEDAKATSAEVMVVLPDGLGDFETREDIENADTVLGETVPTSGREEESRLGDAGRWEDLIEFYLGELEEADEPKAKAGLFKRIAEVFHEHLNDHAQAIDAFVEALAIEPFDNEAVDALESIARQNDAFSHLTRAVDESMQACADREKQAKLCEHLVRWHTEQNTPELAKPYKDRIRQLDPKHPMVQAELAQEYKDQGSYLLAKEAFQRALDGFRRRERVPLYVALGDLHEFYLSDIAEAQRCYQSALEIAPDALDALGGLERIYRAQEKYRELEDVLEKQTRSEVATDEDRKQAYLRLATLNEKHFLRYDVAARKLEEVLAIEPSHDEALAALERCQLAMRAWQDVAITLDRRAALARQPSDKAEMMFRLAEVQESKLTDIDAASATYERIVALGTSDAKALGELARLGEKRQDWGATAGYRARLASLSPDAGTAAQLLVQIGDMLGLPDRDPSSSRHYYERALTLLPNHAGAWEALQKDAERTEDPERIAYCLERRAHFTDAPRLKAQLLVELGHLRKQMGKETAAFVAYQDAILADPTNETAAAAVLPEYAAESRWLEAAPLCELLVNAATRDGDNESAYSLLRLASHIAMKTENGERALLAAIAAHEMDRRAMDAQKDVLVACRMVKDNGALLERARPHVTNIASCSDDLPAESLVHLAEIERAMGDDRAALGTLSRALAKAPHDTDALRVTCELYATHSDFEHAAEFKKRLAEATTGDDARHALFVEAGEVWANRAKNLPMAAVAYEAALEIRPQDSRLLHTLLAVYGELESWEKLIVTLRAVTELDRDPVKKAKGVSTMAQVMYEKIGDPLRAAALFEETIAIDRSRLDAFERVVRIYTEIKDWQRLEKSYRRMLHRTNDDEFELRHALFHQLGLIYRDRLADAAKALEAFRAAGALKPGDPENRKIVTELYVITDRIADAIQTTREGLQEDPSRAELFATLYDLFLRAHAFDKAWCAVSVLAHFGALTPEQRKFHDDYPPAGLSDVPGSLTPSAWRSHIFHPELDPTLTTIFGVLAQTITRVRLSQVPANQRTTAFGEPLRADHSYNAGALIEAVRNASEILHTPVPALFARRGPPTPLAIAPSPMPALATSPEALDTLPRESLAFLVGKRLAELRPELFGRAIFPTVTEMTGALGTALRIVKGESAIDQATQRLDRDLAAQMTAQERSILYEAVGRASVAGAKLDVKQWSQLADVSSSRVGLLLCGHVEYARRAMLQDGQSACDLPPRARVQHMCTFVVGDQFAELRGAIGVGIRTG